MSYGWMKPELWREGAVVAAALLAVGCVASSGDAMEESASSTLVWSEPVGVAGTLEIRRSAHGDAIAIVEGSIDVDRELLEAISHVSASGSIADVYARLASATEIPEPVRALASSAGEQTPEPQLTHLPSELAPVESLEPIELDDEDVLRPVLALGRPDPDAWVADVLCGAENNRFCDIGHTATSHPSRNAVEVRALGFNHSYTLAAIQRSYSRYWPLSGTSDGPWTLDDTRSVPPRTFRLVIRPSWPEHRQILSTISAGCLIGCSSAHRVSLGVDYDRARPDMAIAGMWREGTELAVQVRNEGRLARALGVKCERLSPNPSELVFVDIPVWLDEGESHTYSVPLDASEAGTTMRCLTYSLDELDPYAGNTVLEHTFW